MRAIFMNANTPKENQTSLLRISEVIRRVGYKRTQIYLMIREGRFPQNIQIGPRAVAWDSNDIDEWIASKKNQTTLINEKK